MCSKGHCYFSEEAAYRKGKILAIYTSVVTDVYNIGRIQSTKLPESKIIKLKMRHRTWKNSQKINRNIQNNLKITV